MPTEQYFKAVKQAFKAHYKRFLLISPILFLGVIAIPLATYLYITESMEMIAFFVVLGVTIVVMMSCGIYLAVKLMKSIPKL